MTQGAVFRFSACSGSRRCWSGRRARFGSLTMVILGPPRLFAHPCMIAEDEAIGLLYLEEFHVDPMTSALCDQGFDGGRLARGDHDLLGALRDRTIDSLDSFERHGAPLDFAGRWPREVGLITW